MQLVAKYAMVCTQLGISHVVNEVSRYLSCPSKVHWQAVDLKYLKSTSDYGLDFEKTSNIFIGYFDSNKTDDLDKRRSLTGYIFTIGVCTVVEKLLYNI